MSEIKLAFLSDGLMIRTPPTSFWTPNPGTADPGCDVDPQQVMADLNVEELFDGVNVQGVAHVSGCGVGDEEGGGAATDEDHLLRE